jgi:hypothetical protein
VLIIERRPFSDRPAKHNVGMVDSAFAGTRPVRGDLDVAWIHGSPSHRHRTNPPVQVHAYDEHVRWSVRP